jgi:hypothetical protein
VPPIRGRRDAAAGEPWGDAAGAQRAAVRDVVVAAVGEQLTRLAAGPAAHGSGLGRHRWVVERGLA